jgi:hypothetical protein
VFPEALEAAVRHALGRMPAERYTSVVEFAREVSRVVGGMGAAATVAPAEAATQVLSAQGTDVTADLAPTRVGGAAPAARTAARTPATPTTPRPRAAPLAPPKKKAPVAAIAAVTVALVGVGGFAAMKVLGGGGGAPGDSTTVAIDSQAVAPETTATPGGGGRTQQGGPGTQPDGGQKTSGGADSTGSGGAPAGPAVDVAAIRSELGALLDRVLEGASPADLVRLDAIRDDTRLPAQLRAEAARTAAQAYFDLDAGAGGANLTRACDRLRQARQLEPGNTTGQRMFDRFGCS